MRVYVPCDRRSLIALSQKESLAGPRAGCAVTPALRDWYAEGDDEDWEYAAQSRAADLSLALVADEPAPVRIVLAVDIAADVDADVDPLVGVTIAGDVALADVAAILIDAAPAREAVAAAVAALSATDLDVPPEVEALDEHELAWYAPEEIGGLAASE